MSKCLLSFSSEGPSLAPSLGWPTLQLSVVMLQKRGLQDRPVMDAHFAVSDGTVHWELASTFLDASLHHLLVASHVSYLQTQNCQFLTAIPHKTFFGAKLDAILVISQT